MRPRRPSRPPRPGRSTDSSDASLTSTARHPDCLVNTVEWFNTNPTSGLPLRYLPIEVINTNGTCIMLVLADIRAVVECHINIQISKDQILHRGIKFE